MGDADITAAFAAMTNEMKSVRDEVAGLRAEIKGMLLHGCSRAQSHSDAQHDQEIRLRDIERWMSEQKGKTYAVAAVISGAMTVAGIIVSVMVAK